MTLHSELDQLLDRFRAGGAELVVVLQPDPLPRLPALIDQVAYRVVAEALTNASRHGAELPTDLRITATQEQLTIRVTAAGGRFSAGVDDGRWSVDCVLPLEGSA